MDANTDDVKGRVKEAVGDLTDNDQLKRDGKADRQVGRAKELIDEVGDKAKDFVDEIRDKVHHTDKG